MKSKKEQSEDLDLTIFEQAGDTEFVLKIKSHKEKTKKAVRSFIYSMKVEATETHAASKILVKYIKEGEVSPEEEKELRTQVYDLLKMLGIGVPFALIPGATLLIPFLVKLAQKKGIEILPTAFNGKDDEEIKP